VSAARVWATRLPSHVKGQPSETCALHRVVDRLELTDASRAVLRVICQMADGAGFCWPSVRRLIQDSGYSGRSVFRALRDLQDGGHVDRYAHLRDPQRYGTYLPHRARHGQGVSVYRVGASLRAAAGLRHVNVVEHLGLRLGGPQRACVAPRPWTASAAVPTDTADGKHGTAEWHPPDRSDPPANDSIPAHAPRHPSTENGKPLTHGERLVLSPSTRETDETDNDAFLAALGFSSPGD
jgi:Helix-turn-helix domain